MTRHPYSTNSDERKMVPFFLAVLAVFTAFALTTTYHALHWEPPPSVDAPGALAIYGIYWWLFKKFCWKWKWLRTVNIISTPILDGGWVGQVQTSHAECAATHNVEVIIGQDWTDILIRLRSPRSRSRSLSASMTVTEDECVLIYEYINEPDADAPATLQIHYGTARLLFTSDDDLEGQYYTGRGRVNVGGIKLHRKSA